MDLVALENKLKELEGIKSELSQAISATDKDLSILWTRLNAIEGAIVLCREFISLEKGNKSIKAVK